MTSTITDRVYGESASVALKAPCVAVSNGPLPLVGLTSVGGYAPNVNDRILVKDQIDPTANGIYNASAGTWQRSGDFDGPYDCVQGTLIVVVGSGALYQLTTANPAIGTTQLNFSLFVTALTQPLFDAFLALAGGSLVGAPSSAIGPTFTLQSAPGWGALLAQSTIQVTGPNGLTNANQNVNLTQLLLHGYAAEMVSINGAAPADMKVWSNFAKSDGSYHWRIENDALNAVADYMVVTRTGAFSGSQAAIQFPIGFGIVTINPTVLAGQYQLAIFAGNVAGFSNGLEITAGSGVADHAISVVNSANTANFFQLRGDGSTTFGSPAGGPLGLGTINAQNLFINQAQVMAATPLAGWGTPTGAAAVLNFPGATASLVQCSTALAAIIAAIKQSGTFTV